MQKDLLGLKGARSSINVIQRAVEESRGATYGYLAGCLDLTRHEQTLYESEDRYSGIFHRRLRGGA